MILSGSMRDFCLHLLYHLNSFKQFWHIAKDFKKTIIEKLMFHEGCINFKDSFNIKGAKIAKIYPEVLVHINVLWYNISDGTIKQVWFVCGVFFMLLFLIS